MKTYYLERVSRGLCDFKESVMPKFIPALDPKDVLPTRPRAKYIKNTYSPLEIKNASIKPDVYKFLSRYSICDYALRVKHNAIKHLKLHLKEDKLIEIGALEEQ